MVIRSGEYKRYGYFWNKSKIRPRSKEKNCVIKERVKREESTRRLENNWNFIANNEIEKNKSERKENKIEKVQIKNR